MANMNLMLSALAGGAAGGYIDWSKQEQTLRNQLKLLKEQQKFAKSQAAEQMLFKKDEAAEQRALQERLSDTQTKRLLAGIKAQQQGQRKLQEVKIAFGKDMKRLDRDLERSKMTSVQEDHARNRIIDLIKIGTTYDLGEEANNLLRDKIAILENNFGLNVEKYLTTNQKEWVGLDIKLKEVDSLSKTRESEAKARKVQAAAMSLQAKTKAGNSFYETSTQKLNVITKWWEIDIENASGDEKKKLQKAARKNHLSILAAMNKAKQSIDTKGMIDPKQQAQLDFLMTEIYSDSDRLEMLNEMGVQSGDLPSYQKAIKDIGGNNIYENLAKPEPPKKPGFFKQRMSTGIEGLGRTISEFPSDIKNIFSGAIDYSKTLPDKIENLGSGSQITDFLQIQPPVVTSQMPEQSMDPEQVIQDYMQQQWNAPVSPNVMQGIFPPQNNLMQPPSQQVVPEWLRGY